MRRCLSIIILSPFKYQARFEKQNNGAMLKSNCNINFAAGTYLIIYKATTYTINT